jgi:hypothetical protein
MQMGQGNPKGAPGPPRQSRKQRGHIMRVEPVERAPQAVIVEIRRRNSWPQQVLDGLIREELRDEIELAMAQAQPIEHQRHRRRAHAHLLA